MCSPEIPLIIDKDKELGSGGSALVLRGKMVCHAIRINIRRNTSRLTKLLISKN